MLFLVPNRSATCDTSKHTETGGQVTCLTFAVSSWIHSISAGGFPSTSQDNVMVVPRSAWILRGRVRNLGPSGDTRGTVIQTDTVKAAGVADTSPTEV